MRRQPPMPFDSIEAGYEYVTLLAEAALEARRDVAEQQVLARSRGDSRREQGFQLAAYKLAQLGIHLNASRRLLGDLRTLQRLLLRSQPRPAADLPLAATAAERRAQRQRAAP